MKQAASRQTDLESSLIQPVTQSLNSDQGLKLSVGKKVAIIQSNYIPWKGYFDLINQVDEFILYDDMQYTKNDWRNRNRIKTQHGAKWLTIPVRGKYLSQIKDTVISYPKWNVKHWRTIAYSYSKAKYFQEYEPVFEELYLSLEERFLSKINYQFLVVICQLLGIDTKISWSMDYHLLPKGKAERVVDLCKQAGATEYISGPAAKSYLDECLFEQEKITLRYTDYSGYPEYEQLFPPFEHSVSIIDLIFNEGPNAAQYMKSFISLDE